MTSDSRTATLSAAEEVWGTAVVDLADPPDPIQTQLGMRTHITVLVRGAPVGVLVIDTPSDTCPHDRLVAAAQREFGDRIDLAFSAPEAIGGGSESNRLSATVIVCTRDRPTELASALASIAQLDPGVAVSVLVVDNGIDNDATRAIVERHGFRLVREPVAGLDRARNRGLVEAQTDIVLFTDDDVEVHPQWAAMLIACFADPRVAAAGGLVLPAALETPAQRTIERHAGFGRGFDRRVIDGSCEPATRAGALGAGASMAFRLDRLIELGGFPEELDAGTPTRSGGDTYGFYRILRAGDCGVYEPRALAFHRHRDAPGEPEVTLAGYSTGTYAYLLRAIIDERDLGALKAMLAWTKNWIGRRTLAAVLRRPEAPPLSACVSEIRGALVAPIALLRARRSVSKRPCVLGGGRKGRTSRPDPESLRPTTARVPVSRRGRS